MNAGDGHQPRCHIQQGTVDLEARRHDECINIAQARGQRFGVVRKLWQIIHRMPVCEPLAGVGGKILQQENVHAFLSDVE